MEADTKEEQIGKLDELIHTHRHTLDSYIGATNGLWAVIQCMLVHERINTSLQIRDILYPEAASEPHSHGIDVQVGDNLREAIEAVRQGDVQVVDEEGETDTTDG